MSPAQAYHELQAEISQIAHIKLVAVSKGRSAEIIRSVYDAGARLFWRKPSTGSSGKRSINFQRALNGISWDFAEKKVPKVIGKFALIHSVDSLELAEAISRASLFQELVTHILLHV